MKHELCFQLGTIIKKVGHDGRVSLQLETDDPHRYAKVESIFLEIHGKLVPFFVESFRIQHDKLAHLKFEDIETIEDAESILGCAAFLPLQLLPPLKGNKFYYHEVIGFEIMDETTNTSAGIIESIFENGPNDLFVLNNKGEEILIPIADDWIKKIEREKKVIIMELPEGLLQVNKKTNSAQEEE
ncbi:MAG: ribosome maturation factor RimM [Bacteroidia bacterium]